MGNKYALAALREKRATLAGELELLKKQVTSKQTELASVDDTLCMFDGSYDPGSIRPKKPYQRAFTCLSRANSRSYPEGATRGREAL